MMKRLFILLIILIAGMNLFSQGEYNVGKIPESLKENAGSVVRLNKISFTVLSKSQAELKQKYAITILHKSHRKSAYFQEVYDQFSKISYIKITIYDKHGKKVKTVPKSDILDLSTFSSSALFADIRQKVYNPEYYEYPFTIEYSFTRVFKGLLSYPDFITQTNYEQSLQKGEFVVNIPKGNTLRYFLKNTEQEPEVTHNKDGIRYKWEFEDIPALRNEKYDLQLSELAPIVKIAPTYFEMDHYVGSAKTWKDFGKWIYSLNFDRDVLPSTTKQELIKLTENVKSNTEKVKLVYEYMQSKTRYVNVVIGIGGWQPFTAMEVEENGYGDCKALTNYTYSLLKSINIESFYTIIKAGSGTLPIEASFPSNQFNHAILCVPDDNDTIWLECTSQRNPFDYLSTFTEGRQALLIKENASELVKTPALTISDNYRKRKAVVIIDDVGNLTASIEKKYQGRYYDNYIGIYYIQGKQRMKNVRNQIHIKTFSLDDSKYSITEFRSNHPYFIEKYDISANKYGKKMGNRFLFDINFFNTVIDVPSSKNKQESDIYIHRSVTKVDSVSFILPMGYALKSVPKNDTLISHYGEFHTRFELDGDTLKYVRKQLIFKGKYPDSEYQDLRSYLKKISVADKRKVLLLPIE